MRVRVPGDKSLTQRALILAALADGESRLSGLLSGGDAASTAGALRALGAGIPPLPPDGGEIRVRGVGPEGLQAPERPLDLGNSGTGARLLMGALAGSRVEAEVDGDDSLRRRPMERITKPLAAMGAELTFLDAPGRLPLAVRGRRPLRAVAWESGVASAQVKSAVLLAGLVGRAPVQVIEPRRSRDHTERMLRSLGVGVLGHEGEGGWRVELRDPPDRIPPLDFEVPGDFSSAAYLLALAAMGGAGEGLRVEGVGVNPTRTAFLDALEAMGVACAVDAPAPSGDGDAAEPVAALHASPGPLRAVRIPEADVPRLIDELPLLAVMGARAEGTTRITGAAELRHKESDRIETTVTNLRAVGAEAEALDDGLEVRGGDGVLAGRVQTRGDHRIAMAFGVLGALPGNRISVDDPACADVSFPGFWQLLERVRGGR